MKIVLILGAGATRAAAGQRPLARRPPLDRDFFEIAQKVDYHSALRLDEHLEQMVGSYRHTIASSLENLTTSLYLRAIDSRPRSPAHRAFLSHLQLLYRVITATTNDLAVGPRSLLYRLVSSELARVEQPEDLSIITFNYDLAAERVLAEIDRHRPGQQVFMFPGCYRFAERPSVGDIRGMAQFQSSSPVYAGGVSVLKLHGSMNWVSTHNSQAPTPNALFNPRRELTILNCPTLMPLISRTVRRRVYGQPIVVPPISGKFGVLHSRLGHIWSTAASSLQSADRVVIVGYSCPPFDIEARLLLSEHMRTDVRKDLVVANPDETVGTEFMHISGVDRVTLYESLKSFLKYDA